jgi:hypothetical protein
MASVAVNFSTTIFATSIGYSTYCFFFIRNVVVPIKKKCVT